MSKGFDYSKWDKIELSDDEDDVHPNIDKESWFRMRHRSRVEREDNEDKDKGKILAEMEKANQRTRIVEHELAKLKLQKAQAQVDASDSDDDDLDDSEGLQTELKQLKKANEERQKKLDEYDKNKKWNVDNMFEVKEERTLVNPKAGEASYNPDSGFAVEKKTATTTATSTTGTNTTASTADEASSQVDESSSTATKLKSGDAKPAAKPDTTTTSKDDSSHPKPSLPSPIVGPTKIELGAMETYHEFTERHAETVEQFMACKTLEQSKEFLLRHGDVLLCENASNYLLLASLEDEMNGERDKMKLTARQSQIISNLAELAKTVHQHPGNVIMPFFARLQERKHLEEFIAGVSAFVDKIIQRAVVKKAEIDAQRAETATESKDLNDIPRQERLGPGGLDPLEVIETLPQVIVEAFESRDVDQLKAALQTMEPEQAEYHMKRCVDSGLWVAN